MHSLPSSTRQEKWDKQALKINLTLLWLQIADKCSSICREHSHCEFIDLIILSHNWLRMRLASSLASMFAVWYLPSTALSTLCVMERSQRFFWHFLMGWHTYYWPSWDCTLFEVLSGRNCQLSASFHWNFTHLHNTACILSTLTVLLYL